MTLCSIWGKISAAERKPVCDFLLVNNTNLHPISHCFQLALSSSQIIAFHKGCPRRLLLMHSFSITSASIAISHILLKTRFFGLHFCPRQYRSTFNHFYVIDHQSYKTRYKKTQNSSHYTVQGHSRSLILVSIESPYATSISD